MGYKNHNNCKKYDKDENAKENSEKIKLLYENAVRLSDIQDSRKAILDSKVNYLLTITIVLYGIIVEFVKIDKMFALFNDNQNNRFYIISLIFMTVLYVIAILTNTIGFILGLIIFKSKKYMTVDSKIFKQSNIMKENNKNELYLKLKDTYANNAINNSDLNEKSYKLMDKIVICMVIEIIILIILQAFLNFISIS